MAKDNKVGVAFSSEELMDLITDDFKKSYNLFCDKAEPRMHEFHLQWESIHHDLVGIELELGTDDYNEYARFISARQNQICREINEENRYKSGILLECSSMNGEIIVIGRLKFAREKMLVRFKN